MYILPDIEFQAPEAIEQFNNSLLREHIAYCYNHSPYYYKLFKQLGLSPDSIRCQADLNLLPITSKEDLLNNAGDFLAVGQGDIVDTCQTSGITGRPLDYLLTMADCERLAYNEMISLLAAGVKARDKVMITCALGRCFMAGMAYYEGVRKIGARAIRTGPGSPAFLADAIMANCPDVIICVPSQITQVADYLKKEGYSPATAGVRLVVCIGEPIRNNDMSLSELGLKLKDSWSCQVAGTYASTEMSTAFTDCTYGVGGHFHPELITIELLDEQGRPVAPGEPGEVIATPLQVTGMPLIRYCTGDIATYSDKPCKCGRNSFRLGPIIGRKNQMMKIRGTSVYPNSIYSALQSIPEVINYYLEVRGVYALSETVLVVAGVENISTAIKEKIEIKLKNTLRIRLEVSVQDAAQVRAKTVTESNRKPVVFFDLRHTHTANN